VGLWWSLLGPFFFLFLRRGRAPLGRPCRPSRSSARVPKRARWPPRLRAVHILCVWLAIWSAHWLLLPGVGGVCLSVPGRKGRPDFVQTSDATLLAGAMLKVLYLGARSCAGLCAWLGKWRRRASRVQNALEGLPPVVRLCSRGAGVGRRGPVVSLLGWASALGPAEEPVLGRDWLRRFLFSAPRGCRAEGHGESRGERVPGHGGSDQLESTRSPCLGRPRRGHAWPLGSREGPPNEGERPETHGGLDPGRVSGYGCPAGVEARFTSLPKAWMGPRGGRSGRNGCFGRRLAVQVGLVCLATMAAFHDGEK